ncbi:MULTISPECIES: helix-turn-helix domain-containing protein [Streptomycetaceae]|uniref:Transcriptional regulator, XRE family n=1 Tax=Streptantibioticus cattleyicolor (strain ATCC 35852 / DSM 46488 / JCM 4925 / NBRC 14057 / NRRL 8057) TaxID=1003195 RepID=F8K391_STREN|nr:MULTISPECIES: helix-turn-helix transcriptional regulator [Streptomycetaceae]AEW93814.1 transcriptional regulator, XRE family [Streptantibioticus cattleyicolor NRRL 8057 = DSM 46488]MYS58498.1 helix-turn-helix domain-containing protein [Streptomyces sp. SID5468]CCB74160.1 DNA-binding protein [Streptantibioticus cattleyicolor NRRL 8057 = DSM 46488]
MTRADNEETASPTMQYLAAMTRTLRQQAGLSQEDLGKRINYTGSAISAIETCKSAPSEKALAGLDEVLTGGTGVLKLAGKYLVLDRYPAQFKDAAKLEMSALSLSTYEVLVVEGLLQTEEYARALISCGYPPLPDERVEELVEARMARKALFDRDPVALLNFVMDESVLRRTIGSAEIMKRQLLHLAECSKRRNVTIQVMPLGRGARGEHAGLGGAMRLIETPDHEHLVYIESQRQSILVRKPETVTELFQRYAMIQAQCLSPDESLALIEQLAGEL